VVWHFFQDRSGRVVHGSTLRVGYMGCGLRAQGAMGHAFQFGEKIKKGCCTILDEKQVGDKKNVVLIQNRIEEGNYEGEMSTHSKKKGRMRGGKKKFTNYKDGGNWDGERRTKTNIPLVPNESVNGKGKKCLPIL
jgi:hypothetical protein